VPRRFSLRSPLAASLKLARCRNQLYVTVQSHAAPRQLRTQLAQLRRVGLVSSVEREQRLLAPGLVGHVPRLRLFLARTAGPQVTPAVLAPFVAIASVAVLRRFAGQGSGATLLLSTSQGVLTHHECIRRGLGGWVVGRFV
jgi:hypothetical protein